VRMVCFLGFTVVYYSVFECGRLVYKLVGRDYLAWRTRMVKGWGRKMCAICKCHVTVRGMPPKPPFVLVCNHLSYVDIPVLLSLLDGVPIAKKEVRSWPIIGYACEGVGVLFVDRTRRRDLLRVNEEIAANVHDRQGVFFFPEGTSSKGADVLPFKPSLLAFPASQGLPVSYASITYQTHGNEPPAHEAICWWRDEDLFFWHALKCFGVKTFDASISFGSEPVLNADRKELADALWHRMKEQFVPVVCEEVS